MVAVYGYVGAAPAKGSPPYHVMLATPVGHDPTAVYTRSLAATTDTLTRCGVQFTLHILQGGCHVDDARNAIIRNFLQTGCTDLFFLDADVGWQAESVVKLLQAPGDIVAGVYPHKSDQGTFPFHPGQFSGRAPNEHGLFEMPKVATGFMRIRRPVLEKLYEIERGKRRVSWPNDAEKAANSLPVARIVERGYPRELGLDVQEVGDDYQSGDYVLCLKARAAGFKVFADPELMFAHAGEKVWRGHYGNHLRALQGVPHPDLAPAVDALKSGDVTAETFARLSRAYEPGGTSFSLRPAALHALWERAREAKAPVLELGSGLSTLVLGLALEGTRQPVHTLEHDLHWWRQTSALLDRHQVHNVVLHYAPLEPHDDGRVTYLESELPEAFGLALIDGPRNPDRAACVWELRERLRDAVLILDDADGVQPLLRMLDKAFDIEVKPGQRRWAVATPSAAKAVAAEPKASPLRPLVVSLTSHPPRFGHLHHALASLLRQDMRVDTTVLWLAREEMAALPEGILQMDGLTVRQCEDLRSYKKLIPALEHYPDAYIVTADDDLVYPRTWLRGLVETYRGPKEIVLRRARRMGFLPPRAPVPTPYNTWPLVTSAAEANSRPGDLPNLFPTSCHGMLVPPNSLAPEVKDMTRARELCPMNDDIWWYWMAARGGSRIRVVGGDPIYDLPTSADGLWSGHNRDGGNDRQIAAMVEAYGMPWAVAQEAVE